MPRKSYAQIQKQLGALQLMVAELSTDPSYGITTRSALPFELPRVQSSARWVVFIDLDHLHEANAQYGYPIVDGKIKRAVHVRSGDCLLRVRWFSGDEIGFVLSGDPEGFCQRLAACLKNEGLSATMAFVPFTHNIEKDIERAGRMVQNAKQNGQRASINSIGYMPTMA